MIYKKLEQERERLIKQYLSDVEEAYFECAVKERIDDGDLPEDYDWSGEWDDEELYLLDNLYIGDGYKDVIESYLPGYLEQRIGPNKLGELLKNGNLYSTAEKLQYKLEQLDEQRERLDNDLDKATKTITLLQELSLCQTKRNK